MALQPSTGAAMRAGASYIKEQRRYFATRATARFPFLDPSPWHGAPAETSYDPDGMADPWVEITDLVDDSATKLQMIDEGPVSYWQATLAGWQFNSSFIGDNHAILCLRRLWPDVENADGWSSWRLWWLGYFKADTITHDWRNAGEWTATVEGLSQYARKVRAPGITLARADLALNASVRTSALLQNMAEEANKGEFLGLPTNSGQNLTDGDDAVPMISANEPTAAPLPYTLETQNGRKLKLNDLFLSPLAGYGTGYQWFTLVNCHSGDPATLHEYAIDIYDQTDTHVSTIALDKFLLTQAAGWEPSGATLAAEMGASGNPVTRAVNNGNALQGVTQVRIDAEEMGVSNATPGSATFYRPNQKQAHAVGAVINKPATVPGPSATAVPPKGFLIVCENRRRFEEMFSVPPGALVIEWRDQNFADGRFGGIAPSAMRLDETAGRIVVKIAANPPGSYDEIDRVTWGPGDDTTDGGSTWNGARVAVPAAGFSIRRIAVGGGIGPPANYDSNSSDDWTAEDVPAPGRRQAGKDADGNQEMADTAWHAVQLPALTCELAQDLNDGDTIVTVNNTGGFYKSAPTNPNLPDQRNILIVADVVPYSDKTADTFTLAEAWAGGNVPAGTRLYPLDANGQAHDAWPIGLVEWGRKQEPVPAVYDIYASVRANPVYPDDGEWHDLKADDWTPVVRQEAMATAALTASIANGDTVISVDATNLWPARGTLYLRHATSTPGSLVTERVTYLAKSPTSVTLASPWAAGAVSANDPQAAVSAVLTAALTASHPVGGPGGAPVRARHVLMVVSAMSDLGRYKLNSFRVYPDMAATPDQATQVDGTDVADFVRYLLVERLGMRAGKYTSITSAMLPRVSTRQASIWDLARDLAESTASHLRYTLAEGGRWRPLPELGSVTDDPENIDWTLAPKDFTLLSAERGQRRTISRVVLPYQVSGARDARIATYPALPDGNYVSPHEGDVLELKRMTVPSDAAAAKIVRYEYNRRAYPVRVRLRLPYPVSDWLHPGCIIRLEASVDNTTDPVANPALHGRYAIRTIDEGRSGRFPHESPESVLTLERLGLVGN